MPNGLFKYILITIIIWGIFSPISCFYIQDESVLSRLKDQEVAFSHHFLHRRTNTMTHEYYLKTGSRYGVDYYRPRKEKKQTMRDDFHIMPGFSYYHKSKTYFNIELKNYQKGLEEAVELNRIEIRRQMFDTDYDIIYNYSYLNVGKESEIDNQTVRSGFYNKPMIDQMRFNGLHLQNLNEKGFLPSLYGGTNSINRVLIGATLKPLELLKIGFLYIGRDNDYNQSTNMFDIELEKSFYNTDVKTYLCYKDMMKGTRTKRKSMLSGYTELNYRIDKFIRLSCGYLREEKDDSKYTSRISAQAKSSFEKLELINTFIYNETDYSIERDVSTILNYKVAHFWTVGLEGAYNSCNYGDDSYYVGLQTLVSWSSWMD